MPRARGRLTLRREDGRVVCEHVEVADTLPQRMRGLIGRRRLPSGTGMVLRPAFSIHTALMRMPIDVVFLDHEQRVIAIFPGLAPWRTATVRAAREIVELAAGECARRGLHEGDRVEWAAHLGDEPVPEPDVSSAGLARPGAGGEVLVASGDRRFVKLLAFLLDGRGVRVAETVSPGRAPDAVEVNGSGVVVVDAGDALGEGLRLAAAIRRRTPDATVVLVGEGAAERAPSSAPVYDKWSETDRILDAIADALGVGRSEEAGGAQAEGGPDP